MRISRRAAALGVLGLAVTAARAEPLGVRDAEVLHGRRDWTARLTTPVYINGKGPFAFVVDTGANRSVMAADLAAELNLPAGRPARVHGIVALQDAETVSAQSFTAGRLRLPIVDVPTLRREYLGCDGFLGLDAFRDRCVAFDFRHGQISILPGRFGGPDPREIGPTLTSDVIVLARERFGQLTITQASVLGQRISCFIDSGAQLSVGNMAMLRILKARTGDRSVTPAEVVLQGATGQQVRGEVAEVPRLGVSALRFNNFDMCFADLHTFSLWGMQDRPAMMMGMDMLSLFERVKIDFRQNTVSFEIAQAMAPQMVS